MPDAIAPGRLEHADLEHLVAALRRHGYEVIAPTVRDEAIVYATIRSASELPIGWTDRQQAASYRLERRDDDAAFGYAVGPHSWKARLHPAAERLWSAHRGDSVIAFEPAEEAPPRLALLGVRACEIAALAIHDRVFTNDVAVDPRYRARREAALVIAVQCSSPSGTCFCASMGTGPAVQHGFDLALTEVLGDSPYFLVEVGSERGQTMIADLPLSAASAGDVSAARQTVANAAEHMGRSLDAAETPALLARNRESPRWVDIAERCLDCANCTMVCPTCFCSTVEDVTSLDGSRAERWRKWDSCFTMDFSYLHGGSVRASGAARYRQWLTHKLSSWVDQFGSSGCVGCGRCITWCPVGIDITEEVRAIRSIEENREPTE